MHEVWGHSGLKLDHACGMGSFWAQVRACMWYGVILGSSWIMHVVWGHSGLKLEHACGMGSFWAKVFDHACGKGSSWAQVANPLPEKRG